jgi:hypothetical protein
MWLGETSDTARNQRRASLASVSHTGHTSQIKMLEQWLEIGLTREFRETCNFGGNRTSVPRNGASDGGVVCMITECMCFSYAFTIQDSDAKPSEGGASNTPLRRDNVECLFLT